MTMLGCLNLRHKYRLIVLATAMVYEESPSRLGDEGVLWALGIGVAMTCGRMASALSD
jgi:hypothetical protein